MNGTWLALGGAALAGVLKSRGSANKWNRDGFPWPQEQLLFHGSASLNPIVEDGFRTREQGAKTAGGGRHDKSVSFTLLPQRAAAIALGLDTLRRGARREMSLVQLLDRLRSEIPNAFPEAITSGYTLQSLTLNAPAQTEHVIFNHLRGTLRKIDAGYRCVVSFDEPPYANGVQRVAGNVYLVPPKMDLGKAFYPGNPGSRKEAWGKARLSYVSRDQLFFDTYRNGLNWGQNAEQCFNPYLIGTDMEALANRSEDDVGIIVATTTVPRVCTDARGAMELGYTDTRENRLNDWHHDCEVGLEDVHGDSYRESRLKRRMDIPFLSGQSDARTWAVEDSGARSSESAMLYVPAEQELRLYCTSCIHVEGRVGMDQIRSDWTGDRITFPWFNVAEKNVAVWPPA